MKTKPRPATSRQDSERLLQEWCQEWGSDPQALAAIQYLRGKLQEKSKEKSEGEAFSDPPTFPLPKAPSPQSGTIWLFSDGACRGNPGPGAWGILGQDAEGGVLFQGSGVATHTTNNVMELTGALEALKNCQRYFQEQGQGPAPVRLYSDSKYVVDGITSWVSSWKRRGWKKGDGKAPENLALWQELEQLAGSFSQLEFIWVKAHAGHPQNEFVDQLANQALDESGF